MNSQPQITERPWFDAALEVAKWIDLARIDTEQGIRWRSTPTADLPVESPEHIWALARGTGGVMLFMLELYNTTDDDTFLKYAQAAADHLAATIPFDGEVQLGLYDGIAGAAYIFELVHQIGDRAKDREAVLRCLATLQRHVPTADGKFFGQGNGIYSGRAGIGLALLRLFRTIHTSEVFDLALLAGNTVRQRAQHHKDGGVYWNTGDASTCLPGFSIGDAGAAYFLAVLYEETGERAFLETAIEAAHRIQHIAVESGRGCLIPMTSNAGGKLVEQTHVAWCHGAVGIWRLFFQLARVTNEAHWTEWVHRLAQGVMDSGVPEKREPFLPTIAIHCCGDAGVARGFLDLYTAYGNPEYIIFARRMHSAVMQFAIVDELGMRWKKSAHSDLLDPPATLFTFGAAGVGTWLLHLDGFEQRRPALVKLPDSPF